MENTSTCSIEGNADMYGLGIRLGFYMQWYGSILAEWLAPKEVPSLRDTNAFSITATFIALVILRDALYVPEIYILLLLFFGSTFYILLVALFRLALVALRSNSKYWDPTRYSASKPRKKTANLLWSLLLLGELSFLMWFWATRIPTLDTQACERYGFMFVKIRLNARGFFLFHIIISSLLMMAILGLLIWSLDSEEYEPEEVPAEQNSSRTKLLRALGSIIKLCVAVVINVAVELTIAWNEIRGLNFVGSAGQLIPTIIGVGAVLRVLYVFIVGEDHDLLENRDEVSIEQIRKRTKKILHRDVKIAHPSGGPETYIPPVPRDGHAYEATGRQIG